jgi:non-ribosomal peptide synthase protein (TIGR01720 family)
LVLPDDLGAALAGSVHGAFNTNTQDFLLAALLSACADWTGSDTLGVMLEGHGRDADDVDCGRTVGWFTTMYPVSLRAPRDARGDIDPISLVTAVKEQLRAVPGQGSGYAALRYLAPQGAGGRAWEPSLCFNYLGRFGTAADTAQLHAASAMHLAQHATRSVVQPRLFAIEVLAMQYGDQLVVNIVYNPGRIADASVEQLCLRLQVELARLIAACSASDGGLTPSDVPDLHLQQDDLDALLAELSDVV